MASIFLKKLKRICHVILRLLLTITFLSVCPFILIFHLILLLYRFLILKTAKYFDPSLGKMVSAISNFFAAHDIYGNSFTTNIALHFVGKVDKPHMIQGLQNLMENYKTPNGTFMYPELTQRIVRRYGYTFWENVDNFRMEDHVQYLNESEPDAQVNLEEMQNLIAKFGKTPLDKNRSPWVVYIVKNFRSDREPNVKSALVFRLHHSMFDGISIFNFFGKMADNGPIVLEGQAKLKELEEAMGYATSGMIGRIVRGIVRPFVIIFCGSYYLMGLLMNYDRNELIQRNHRDFKGVMRFHECEPVPLEELRKVKNHYGVKMSTLLTTLSLRSLKRFMEKRGYGYNAGKINMSFPLPVLNHPDKLRNFFSGGILSFDLEHNNRIQLLHEVETKYKDFRYSYVIGLPEASMFFLKILGSLPSFLVPKIDEKSLSTTLINSSFPGPVSTGYFCGFPVVDATVCGSMAKPYPVGTLSYSYRGFYKFGWQGDLNIFPKQEDIQELGDGVLEELKHFQRGMGEDKV